MHCAFIRIQPIRIMNTICTYMYVYAAYMSEVVRVLAVSNVAEQKVEGNALPILILDVLVVVLQNAPSLLKNLGVKKPWLKNFNIRTCAGEVLISLEHLRCFCTPLDHQHTVTM